MIALLRWLFSQRIQAAEFERSVFSYVRGRITDKQAVWHVLEAVDELAKEKVPERRENHAAHHYLTLEEHIANGQATGRMPKEVLREQVYRRCRPENADGHFRLLFLPSYERQMKLYEYYADELFLRARQVLGETEYGRALEEIIEKAKLAGIVQNGVFSWVPLEQSTQRISGAGRVFAIRAFVRGAIDTLAKHLMRAIEAARTEILISETYRSFEERLDFLDDVEEILYVIPEQFLSEERIGLMEKEQLEVELRSTSEELEMARTRLHAEEERLSTLTREELEKRVRERTAELLKALEDVKASRAQLEEFSSLATHELRAPAGIIKGYASLLLDGTVGDMPDNQRKFVRHIKEANERLIELINAMLNASRIELGTLAIEPEPLYLRDLAEKVIAELTPQIAEKQLVARTDFDYRLPLVSVDPRLMRAVIQNLVSNAVKYTPPQGVVSVSIAKQDANVLITVQDTGYGIPKEQQAKIFTKLFRGDNVRVKQIEGTGLGLYIAKSVVEQSGGRIWFESPPAAPLPEAPVDMPGTVFYVTIPLEGMKRKEGIRGLT